MPVDLIDSLAEVGIAAAAKVCKEIVEASTVDDGNKDMETRGKKAALKAWTDAVLKALDEEKSVPQSTKEELAEALKEVGKAATEEGLQSFIADYLKGGLGDASMSKAKVGLNVAAQTMMKKGVVQILKSVRKSLHAGQDLAPVQFSAVGGIEIRVTSAHFEEKGELEAEPEGNTDGGKTSGCTLKPGKGSSSDNKAESRGSSEAQAEDSLEEYPEDRFQKAVTSPASNRGERREKTEAGNQTLVSPSEGDLSGARGQKVTLRKETKVVLRSKENTKTDKNAEVDDTQGIVALKVQASKVGEGKETEGRLKEPAACIPAKNDPMAGAITGGKQKAVDRPRPSQRTKEASASAAPRVTTRTVSVNGKSGGGNLWKIRQSLTPTFQRKRGGRDKSPVPSAVVSFRKSGQDEANLDLELLDTAWKD